MEGSVLDEAQYNQAYEVMNELHTINPDRYIIAVEYAVKMNIWREVCKKKPNTIRRTR